MTADSFDDRLRAIEDELRTPWTLLTAALDDLGGTVVDVDGRAAIELARRSVVRMQAVAEAFFAGRAVPDATPGEAAATRAPVASVDGALRVLIADDNADLRAYLATMLAGKYAVDTVSDGAALVAAAIAQRPGMSSSPTRACRTSTATQPRAFCEQIHARRIFRSADSRGKAVTRRPTLRSRRGLTTIWSSRLRSPN